MGTVLLFHSAMEDKQKPAFRERRVKAGNSAEVIVFPGVRIERHGGAAKSAESLSASQHSADSAGQSK